jgi:hypothetical protein
MTDQNPLARRAAILIGNTTGTPEQIAAALNAAGMLARPAFPVAGPYPLWVHPTYNGAVLDPHLLMRALFQSLAKEFAEDGDGVGEELGTIAEASGPELDALLDKLLDRLGGTELRYGATELRLLVERLASIVGPAVPVRQNRSAA